MAKNTIKVKNFSNVNEEYTANAAITPGHLVELMTTDKVRVHATADGVALAMFAVEDELRGKKITEAYAAADPVQVWIPGRGDMVYALLANGQNAAIGNFLASNGDGTLKVIDEFASAAEDLPLSIVAQAVEAVDMSDSSAADPSGRIIVRIV